MLPEGHVCSGNRLIWVKQTPINIRQPLRFKQVSPSLLYSKQVALPRGEINKIKFPVLIYDMPALALEVCEKALAQRLGESVYRLKEINYKNEVITSVYLVLVILSLVFL